MKTQVSTRHAQPPERRFRTYLREELARRCAANRRYSLRAFARFLDLDHSTLSQLLRGRRPFSPRSIERLGARLRLAPEAIGGFVEGERESVEPWVTREVRQLAQDAARLLEEWHHYAILELTRLPSFEPDVRWIARVLGLTHDQVNVAIQRLLRLGLLKMGPRGRWTDTLGDAVSTVEEFSQRTISGLAERASALPRGAQGAPAHHSATTLAVAGSRSGAAIARLERFRRDFVDFLESAGSEPDQVYRLEIAFLPLADLDRKEPQSHGQTRDALADPRERP